MELQNAFMLSTETALFPFNQYLGVQPDHVKENTKLGGERLLKRQY